MNYSQSTLDPQGFRVVTLNAIPNPQTCAWYAKQDYMEGAIADIESPTEKEAGEWAVKALLKKKHIGPLEHPSIIFNVVGFPHSTMQQMRTHRTGNHFNSADDGLIEPEETPSFDVQSGRYSGRRFLKVADYLKEVDSDPVNKNWNDGRKQIESILYFRPAGDYTDRSGKKYTVYEEDRQALIDMNWYSIKKYADLIEQGYSEEHARSVLPWDIVRQNFVLSCNMRSLLHFFAMRSSKEAQLECRQLCDLMIEEALKWAPEIFSYYADKHYGKAFIAP